MLGYPQSWLEALHLTETHRTRKVAHNTTLVDVADGIGIQYHDTIIVVFRPDGSTELNTGGWFTSTTKARFNHCGFRTFQCDSQWFLTTEKGTFEWNHNAIIVEADGSLRTLGRVGLVPIDSDYRAEKFTRGGK